MMRQKETRKRKQKKKQWLLTLLTFVFVLAALRIFNGNIVQWEKESAEDSVSASSTSTGLEVHFIDV